MAQATTLWKFYVRRVNFPFRVWLNSQYEKLVKFLRGHIMFYVYILLSLKDKNFYIGYTFNLKQRLKQHFLGEVISTKSRLPLKLIYYEAFINKTDAKKREKFLKSGSGLKFLKKQLVNTLEIYISFWLAIYS